MIQRILNEFDDKVGIFAEVLDNLESYLAEEKKRTDEHPQRVENEDSPQGAAAVDDEGLGVSAPIGGFQDEKRAALHVSRPLVSLAWSSRFPPRED